jgi:MFS family permease
MYKPIDYQNHFQRELLPILGKFEERRKSVISKVILSKIFGILTAVAFFSIFMGFLNAFPFDEFEMSVVTFFFQGFFYLVLCIVIVSIILNALKYILRMAGNNVLLKDRRKLFVISTVFGLFAMLFAYLLGRYYLGEEVFTAGFFLKYFLAFFVVIFFGLLSNFFGKYEKKYNLELKSAILPGILRFIKSDIQYSPTAFIRQSDFVDSQMFPNKEIYSYKGSDFATGSYGEGLFAFSQLNIREISRTRSHGKSETKISDLFTGLFYIADFNKPFSGRTVIYPDFARMALGAQFGEMLNKSIGTSNAQLVQLEDVEFEKLFAVYSTDQIEARYILTPSMIERIKTIHSKLDKEIYFSFANKRVYIAIEGETEFLVPMVFRDLTKFESLEPIYFGIESLIEIANDLQLNTRIWGRVGDEG